MNVQVRLVGASLDLSSLDFYDNSKYFQSDSRASPSPKSRERFRERAWSISELSSVVHAYLK